MVAAVGFVLVATAAATAAAVVDGGGGSSSTGHALWPRMVYGSRKRLVP